MKLLLFIILFVTLVYGHPAPRDAAVCQSSACKIEDGCRCSSTTNPISDPSDPAPQLIAITISESVVGTLYERLDPLFFNRKNPDGNPIGLTFYVNHEYTDYELVQDLYLRGYEIGVHSITKNSSQAYWRQASLEDLIEEFQGQRQIISHFANIPIEEVVGGRTPQLQLEGDLSIEAYVQSGLIYDNSWPTRTTKPILPYSLDYASTQECAVTIKCPSEPHEDFWIVPLTNIQGEDNVECNSLATCLVEGTSQEIATWLINQVDRIRNGNRAPLVLRLDQYWFDFIHNSYEGFVLFLDEMAKRDDTFFVSVSDILKWIKNPVSASNYETPVHNNRRADCIPVDCRLIFLNGSERYMRSCVQCPLEYPWKGNPLGK